MFYRLIFLSYPFYDLLTVKEKAQSSDNFTNVLKRFQVLFYPNIFLFDNDTQEFSTCHFSPRHDFNMVAVSNQDP